MVGFLSPKTVDLDVALACDVNKGVAVVLFTRPFNHAGHRAVMYSANLLVIILVAMALEDC